MEVAEFRPNATYLEGRVQVVFQYGRQERPASMPAPAVGLNDSFFLFLAKCESIGPRSSIVEEPYSSDGVDLVAKNRRDVD
jgi:hypothetical protein